MKLLIVTQKVDNQDPILGFFCGWIAEFAQSVPVTVIAQSVGQHTLPPSVNVLSLGKESGATKLQQIARFWSRIWAERLQYDRVFVHMTPIWVILGAPVWVLLRKRVHLWYEIKRGSVKFAIAKRFACTVFAATSHGVPGHVSNLRVVGHGIDTVVFHPDAAKRDPNLIVAVGRITQVKRYDVILDAFAGLPSSCRLKIAGDTITHADHDEYARLLKRIAARWLTGRVETGWVSPDRMPELLQRATLMLHASEGGLDKVVLQSMACGCPVVSVSEAAQSVLPESCRATADTLAMQAAKILALSEAERQKLEKELCSVVLRDHDLRRCIASMIAYMQ
ncbi:glycosyltransferase family 4 protein [Candidatus Peregrinibacteria bacterium]|nr:glycosyltransferase family 4 protein [Candidatus Peregrinibacteria bacterium]